MRARSALPALLAMALVPHARSQMVSGSATCSLTEARQGCPILASQDALQTPQLPPVWTGPELTPAGCTVTWETDRAAMRVEAWVECAAGVNPTGFDLAMATAGPYAITSCPAAEAWRWPGGCYDHLPNCAVLIAGGLSCATHFAAPPPPAAFTAANAGAAGSEVGARLARDGVGSGEVLVALSWATESDLDISVRAPDGSTVNYQRKYAGGGVLAADARGAAAPVEAVVFATAAAGEYAVSVTQRASVQPREAEAFTVC